MITKLILRGNRAIEIYTSDRAKSRRAGAGGGLRWTSRNTSAWFDLSPAEQERLRYALTDHKLRKTDEIKELR